MNLKGVILKMSSEEAKGKFYVGMLLPSELLKPRSAEACVLRQPVLMLGEHQVQAHQRAHHHPLAWHDALLQRLLVAPT